MKLTLIAIFIALLSCSLMIGNGSSAKQETQTSPRLIVSKEGTLTELFDINGNSLGKVAGDGFKLTYWTLSRLKSASASETRIDRLKSLSESPTLKENTATAVVQTDDRVLEITSSFTWNREDGELIIMRKFKNISKDSVRLQTIWNQVDTKLLFGDRDNHSFDLARLTSSQPVITAGLKEGSYDCDISKCPLPPPCLRPPCPPLPVPDYFSARYTSSSKGAVLGWSEPITLAPQQKQKPGGEAFIIIRITGKYLTGRS